jgi:hypothetical protein
MEIVNKKILSESSKKIYTNLLKRLDDLKIIYTNIENVKNFISGIYLIDKKNCCVSNNKNNVQINNTNEDSKDIQNNDIETELESDLDLSTDSEDNLTSDIENNLEINLKNDTDNQNSDVLKTIDENKISETYVRLILRSVVWYSEENNINKNAIKMLEFEIKKINAKVQKIYVDKLLTGTQKDNYITWEEIGKMFIELEKNKNKNQKKYIDYMIIAIYYLQVPRRVADYALMHVCKNENNIENNKNYYVNNKRGYMIFHNFKTVGFIKKQKFPVPAKLDKIIKFYIQKYNITDSLLDMNVDFLSKTVKRISYKWTKKQATVNIFRHAYITYMNNSDKLSDPVTRINIADKMAHSTLMQLMYRKDESKKD